MEMEDAVEVLPSSASCMISASGQMEMEDAVWCYQARGGGQAGMLLLLPRQAAGRSSPTRFAFWKIKSDWLFSQQLALLLLQWAIGLALHSCAPRVTLLEPASATREASADALVMTDGQRFSLL